MRRLQDEPQDARLDRVLGRVAISTTTSIAVSSGIAAPKRCRREDPHDDLGYGTQRLALHISDPAQVGGIIQRKAVRALLVRDSDDRVLLLHAKLPDRNLNLWITPGGGVEVGETPRQSLIREVAEETGLDIDGHQGLVWQRRHQFTFRGRRYDQQEDFYLVRTAPFDPTHLQNPAAHERELFDRFHWWSIEEIARSDEIFVPGEFAKHFADLLRHGPPRDPVRVGI